MLLMHYAALDTMSLVSTGCRIPQKLTEFVVIDRLSFRYIIPHFALDSTSLKIEHRATLTPEFFTAPARLLRKLLVIWSKDLAAENKAGLQILVMVCLIYLCWARS